MAIFPGDHSPGEISNTCEKNRNIAPEGVEAREWNINGEKAVLSVRKNG